jgi:hypothetical protein
MDVQTNSFKPHASRIPTESRIFTDRYIREARRLEKLHADRLAPGAATWEQAVELLYKRMVRGGPVLDW